MSLIMVILMASAIAMVDSQYVNDYDQPFRFVCPIGQSINLFQSKHSNKKEDRRFMFNCQATPGYTSQTSCVWYNNLNQFDKLLHFTCPNNAVISGISSYHDNGKEDRRFSVYCCHVPAMLYLCSFTGYVTNWDEEFVYIVPSGRFLTGLSSYHDNKKEDRRWSFGTCDMA